MDEFEHLEAPSAKTGYRRLFVHWPRVSSIVYRRSGVQENAVVNTVVVPARRNSVVI